MLERKDQESSEFALGLTHGFIWHSYSTPENPYSVLWILTEYPIPKL